MTFGRGAAIILMVLLYLAGTAQAYPNITSWAPLTDPTDAMFDGSSGSRAFNITINTTARWVDWQVNGTSVQLTANVTTSTYTNASWTRGIHNITVISYNASNYTFSNKTWSWNVTLLPLATKVEPTTGAITDTNASLRDWTFNISVDRDTYVTWAINGITVQTNASTTTCLCSNYTNRSTSLGTHNVTVIVNNSNGTGNMLSWTWNVPISTMTGAAIITNLSSSDRVFTTSNTTLNLTWTDTGNISTINITFPSQFTFGAVWDNDVNTSIGTDYGCSLSRITGGTQLGCYNVTAKNNSFIYLNLSKNMTMPSTSGTYSIRITTNKNTTGINFTVYARDPAKPLYASANNSVFTIGTETFGTLTTTVPLTGTGVANLTFYSPNLTSQHVNFSIGWSATNATLVRVNRTGGITKVYVETNPSVANPIIILSAPNDLESGNLPSAILAGGIVSGLVVVYAYLQRRRRH